MAGAKETPRQKMIGMMYMVLLAMLAMNVSKEVLNSFIIINAAIEKTNDAFTAKNQQVYADFGAQNSQNPEKVGEYYAKAKQVMEAGDKVYDSITVLKRFLIYKTEGAVSLDDYVNKKSGGEITTYSPEVDTLFNIEKIDAKDNYDFTSHQLIGGDTPQEGPRTAVQLHTDMEEFFESVVKLIPQRYQADFRKSNEFDFSPQVVSNEGKKEDWEMANFNHLPLAAVVTNLSRIQTEIRNIQSEALDLLFGEISAKDFKFDKIEAKVIANSNYVTLGDSFNADVIVAAYSTTENPELLIGSSIDSASGEVVNPVPAERITVKNGVGHYGFKPTVEGEVKWGGFVVIKDGLGVDKKYAFEHTFIAAKPSTVVSPTKMNVVYRGLENPIEVSVSGYASSKITASASNGSLSGSNGKYMLKPGNGKECKITVSVKSDDGSSKTLGEGFTFRVKDVPAPIPSFAGASGTAKVPAAKLKVSSAVLAKMEDFDFEGVNWEVISFEILGSNKGQLVPVQRARGNRLTSTMKQLMAAQQRGDRIFVQNIRARGPGGVEKNLGNISIEVQ